MHTASPDGFSFALSFFGPDARQAEQFWDCLPNEVKKQIRFYLGKCGNRPLWSEAATSNAGRTRPPSSRAQILPSGARRRGWSRRRCGSRCAKATPEG
jgi:hypothetical protein